MPGTRCTVAVCNNSFEKTKRAGVKILYHAFPKSQPLRKIWVEKCRRGGQWNPDSCHICSLHFTDDDYKQDKSLEIKKRLKSTAVPSLYLNEIPPIEFVTRTRKCRVKKPIDESWNHDKKDVGLKIKILPISTKSRKNSLVEIDDDVTSASAQEEIQSTLNDMEISCMGTNMQQNALYSQACVIQSVMTKEQFTQTDNDYFIENYKSLLDVNKHLVFEMTKCNNNHKKLMKKYYTLEAKLQLLTLDSKKK